MKRLVTIIGIVVLAVGAATAERWAKKRDAEIDSLRREISALKLREPAPREVLREVVREREIVTAAPSASAAIESAVGIGANDEQRIASQEERAQRLRDRDERASKLFQETFSAEARDPGAEKATETIMAKYSEDQFRPLQQVVADCKTTICQVTFAYSDPGEGLKAVNALNADHPWSGSAFVTVDTDSRRGTVYLAREHAELPALGPAMSER